MAPYIVQSLIVLLSLLNIAFFANAANILAILPSVWKSHFIYGRRLMQQLVEHNRNHSVTLISPHANENDTEQLQNIREIRVEGLLQNWEEMGMSFDIEQMRSQSGMERFTRLIYAGTTNVDLLLTDAQVRALLQSGEHFDLIVIDLFLNDALLGFSFLNRAPTVVLSPTGSNTWLNHMLGNPQNSAVDPSNFLPFTERMNIWERSVNTLMLLFEKLTYNFFHMITQQAVYAKHFQAFSEHANRTLLHHRELTKNLSLVLLNSNAILQYPRAHLPNMLTIAGAHLQRSGDLLIPNHLLEFIETATHGVVYISFGANIRTADLPIEKLNILLDVFEYLKDLRFLLKWENEHDDNINLPANVMINEWFPQEAILAHNNVKLFISSCGLMSIVEAVNGATPMLAIPIYSEHHVAARRLQSQNVALIIQYEDIAYDSLLYSIKQLVYTPSFSLSMQKLRRQFNYDSISPSKNALHYIELILQTNGGDFLKSHANNLNFLRTELLDVILIIAIGVGCIIAVPFFVTCCILRKSYQAAAEGEEARDGGAYHAKLLKVMGRSNSYTDGEQEARMRRRGSTTSASMTTTTSSSSTSLYNPSGIYNKSI